MSRDKEDEEIIPITEWPVSSDSFIKVDQKEKDLKRSLSINDNINFNNSKKVKKLGFSTSFSQQDVDRTQNNEPLANIRIARWWRKNKPNVDVEKMPDSTNPNTTLLWVSRTKECQQFLRKEEELLVQSISHHAATSASAHAALASVRDWLGLNSSALDNIKTAVKLNPQNTEYEWLKEKLTRQSQVVKTQKQFLTQVTDGCVQFPKCAEVDRVSINNLSKKDFYEQYVKTHTPVILLDLVQKMTLQKWDLNFVRKTAGEKKVTLKKLVPFSAEWARLEDSRTSTVEEFIDAIRGDDTKDYLFDWSLPLHCPELAASLKLPSFFEDNYLTSTSPGSLYHDSWPSLFIAPSGAVSQLHVDAFASSFWMALFEGEKRWTFFPPSDTPLLYPTYTHSMDPVFHVNLLERDVSSYPLLSLTHPRQCVLQPGELLYVPSGSPHFVENLSVSLAVSSNYVNDANYTQVCEELRVNGLIDHRAKDLHQQLQLKYG